MYRIADFNIDFKNMTVVHWNLKEFRLPQEDSVVEFEIFCSNNEIMAEDRENKGYRRAYLENVAFHRKLAEALPGKNAFVFHSAVFDVEGIGVALAAHSGTGKTTHMNRWQSYLGDKMTVVNGDKPIVRFFDSEPEIPYAYGTPWMGKENLGCNMRTPLKHICFIERSDDNFVERIDKDSAVNRIMNQVYMPRDPAAVMKTMQLADRLLSCCKLWIIHCNMDDNAGEIAYKLIFEN